MSANANEKLPETESFPDELLPGTTLLRGQYTIHRFLNRGGFGITYLAKDSLERLVVIKECFPGTVGRHSGTTVRVRSDSDQNEFTSMVELFVQEARSLAKLKHPNIVGVHQVFEDNDTAYMALDYVQGRDLMEVIENPNDVLLPADIQMMTRKILNAVEFIHSQGVLHRDISPDNILLTKQNNPVLIDFGAAREEASKASRALSAMRAVKDGYSPQEFYVTGSQQSASSDLYALAASLYHLITGAPPPDSEARLAAVVADQPDPYSGFAPNLNGYENDYLAAISLALNIYPADRIQSAGDWLKMIQPGPRRVAIHPAAADASKASQLAASTSARPATPAGTSPEHMSVTIEKPNAADSKVRQPAVQTNERENPRQAAPEPNLDMLREHSRAKPGKKGKHIAFHFGTAAAIAVAGYAASTFLFAEDPSLVAESSKVEIAVDVPPEAAAQPAVVTALVNNSVPVGPITQNSGEVVNPQEAIAATEFVTEAPVLANVAADLIQQAAPVAPDVPATFIGNPSEVVAITRVEDAVPVAKISALPSEPAAETPILTDPTILEPAAEIPAPEPKEFQPAGIIDASVVMAGWSVVLPFSRDSEKLTTIREVTNDRAPWMRPGQKIVSVNGVQITSIDEINGIVKSSANLSSRDSIKVQFLYQEPGVDVISAGVATLSPARDVALLNGTVFRSQQDEDGTWKTTVTTGPSQLGSGIQVGDQIVAYIPTGEKLTGKDTISNILEREILAGVTKFDFAVNREGQLWFASFTYSAGGQN